MKSRSCFQSEEDSCLDLMILEKVRHAGEKVTARCPACAERGGDRKGNHLTIFSSGKFACAACPGDHEHRRRIFALVGYMDRTSSRQKQYAARGLRQAPRPSAAQKRHCLKSKVRELRGSIIARHPWPPEDVWEDSPQRIDCDLVANDPRWFLSSLFTPKDLIWSGEVYHSGPSCSSHWRTVNEWFESPIEELGPMVAPAVWKPGTISRKADHVAASPYVVLDFDGFDGVAPDNSDKVEKHRLDSLGLIRWLREGLHWQLAALIWTGSKSIHAWFHTPPKDVLESLRNNAAELGIDAGLIGRPEHPCRLPGQIHAKTGSKSRVLWLQLPTGH